MQCPKQFRLLRRFAAQGNHDLEVFDSRQLGFQAVVMTDVEQSLAELIPALPNVRALPCNAAVQRRRQSGQGPQQCGLAAAIGALQLQRAASRDLEPDILYQPLTAAPRGVTPNW